MANWNGSIQRKGANNIAAFSKLDEQRHHNRGSAIRVHHSPSHSGCPLGCNRGDAANSFIEYLLKYTHKECCSFSQRNLVWRYNSFICMWRRLTSCFGGTMINWIQKRIWGRAYYRCEKLLLVFSNKTNCL